MSNPGKSIVKSGINLLAQGTINIDDFAEAFQLAGVHQTDLRLGSLKSLFGGGMYFAPKALSPNEINYPVHDPVADFLSIKDIKPDDDEEGLTALERYGSFVSTDADCSVSVFDLFKTAAAIQDCLEYGVENNPFLLVSADFSGIQDTVYTISSKGALKTLRARSFMLELLTEHIVFEILQICGSERYAVIYSGGGGFSLLIPNREGNDKKIEMFQDILNRWAYKEFSGKFFIAMEALSFDKSKFDNQDLFIDLRRKQADNLDKLKRRKFLHQLDELFMPVMPRQLTNQTECQITRRDDLPASEMRDLESGTFMDNQSVINPNDDKWTWVSESCFHQFKLGDKLTEGFSFICRSNIALGETPKNFGYLKFPTIESELKKIKYCWYYLSQKKEVFSDYWQINSWEGDETPFLYANYVRKHGDLSDYARSVELNAIQGDGRKVENSEEINNDTATFEGLSSCSCGANLIGALRMDVDDMGNLFSSIGTFPELSAKSRMLNIFFKVYLNEICRGELGQGIEPTDIVRKIYKGKGRNVSVIYSGGDDLFILGAWDESAELAFDIQRCFALFSGGTLQADKNFVTGGLGISGGITLHQPKYPLYQMARKSGEAEHVAKHARKALKNCFTPFLLGLDNNDKSYEFNNNRTVRVIDWNDIIFFKLLENLVALAEKQFVGNQIDAIKLESVSRGFIYKLFEAAKVWVAEGSLYLPRLRYLFSRLEKQYADNKNSEIKKMRSLLFSSNQYDREKSIKLFCLTLNWFEQLQRSK